MYKSVRRRMEKEREELQRKCKHEVTILKRIEKGENNFSETCKLCGKDLGTRHLSRAGRGWKE